jgi:hypothetical protein
MKLNRTRKGYLKVNLDVGGKNVARCVHQLVLEAFVGPKPEGQEGCHFPDPDKSNNSVANLRWDTHLENVRDRVRGKPDSPTKVCRRCLIAKPKEAFYRDKRASDGLQLYCKECHTALCVATRDPEKRREANRMWMRKWRANG